MIVDCITFNGEFDLLELRLNILDRWVDQFIICEAQTTFSGNPKPLYFDTYKERYHTFLPKIKYYVIPEDYTVDETRKAQESPNTQGALHWQREFLQKESIKDALLHLDTEDIVYIGDCDEIWDTKFDGCEGVNKLKLKVYSYYLDNRSTEDFHGTIVAKYKDIRDECLNHLRSTNHVKTEDCFGWHFTNMGGYYEVKRKLEDSYTHETYAHPSIMNNLEYNVSNRKDFLGRHIDFYISEQEWPQYLKDNREEYQHLLYGSITEL